MEVRRRSYPGMEPQTLDEKTTVCISEIYHGKSGTCFRIQVRITLRESKGNRGLRNEVCITMVQTGYGLVPSKEKGTTSLLVVHGTY